MNNMYALGLHIIFSIILTCLIFSISFILILRTPNLEKLSAYECGFDPFESTHSNFEVRYFLVGLLFIVFDVEVSFLFPFTTLNEYVDIFAYFTMITFLFVLKLGYIYEYRKGALDFC
jgi:NADH:ubiquinone oxidoreductase subunit 3 (subunit A)